MTTNNNGNTPLHLASTNYFGKDCVKKLLLLDAPIMLRNAAGETARDVAHYSVKPLLDAFITTKYMPTIENSCTTLKKYMQMLSE